MDSQSKMDSSSVKKRGRRPKKSSHDDVDVDGDSEKDTPVILQLSVSSNDVSVSDSNVASFEDAFCKYDPSVAIPNAYDQDTQFESQPFELSSTQTEDTASSITLRAYDNEEAFPMRSDHACYWCCHTFDTRPFGLPVKYKSDTFYVSGNFCSMECLSAYNFDTNINVSNIWETYNLISFMARRMSFTDPVYPAPPRKCLSMFGGYMSIHEFREYCKSSKIVNYTNCPLIAIIDQVEEINNFYHKHKDTDVLQFDKARLKKYESRLKLQQEAMIEQNYDNTLDRSMGII